MENLGVKLENFETPDERLMNDQGAALFENLVQSAPGLDACWKDLGGDRDAFTKAFREYIDNGSVLKTELPEQYKFLKDHVFYGKEFEKVEKIQTIFGDPGDWGKVLDWRQGDNDYNFEGDCGLVSCENILEQAGIDISETDIVKFAAENGFCEVANDPTESGGTTTYDQAAVLTDLGVPSHVENNLTPEDLAQRIKNDQGVIIEINAGVLWDDAAYYGNGEANHAITLTGVDINQATGKIDGFYVCDSGRGKPSDGARFVSYEQMKDMFCLDYGSQAVVTDVPIKC